MVVSGDWIVLNKKIGEDKGMVRIGIKKETDI